MKKLILALVLSVFAVSSAAYACDGMKGHEKTSDTQAKKDGKKSEGTKSDQKS
jgi:hypothetical protein